MSSDQSLFPRPPRGPPKRRAVLPLVLLGLVLAVVALTAPSAWGAWRDRQAWAQAQAIARGYLQTADSDDRRAQAEITASAYNQLLEGGLTHDFDLAKAQAQLDAGRVVLARYRSLAVQRKAAARAAIAALKVSPRTRDRYLARLDDVVFRRPTQLSHRLDAIAGVMDEEQAALEMLASHRGQWRMDGNTIVFARKADMDAFYGRELNIWRRQRDEARIAPLKIPTELWTTTPP